MNSWFIILIDYFCSGIKFLQKNIKLHKDTKANIFTGFLEIVLNTKIFVYETYFTFYLNNYN